LLSSVYGGKSSRIFTQRNHSQTRWQQYDSQNIKFHENGTIKSIGQTKKGRGNGTTFYFDRNGILEKTVELENGNIKK
jgi:antitoxin component YwqK of YwqJK toxin-antitoxin module